MHLCVSLLGYRLLPETALLDERGRVVCNNGTFRGIRQAVARSRPYLPARRPSWIQSRRRSAGVAKFLDGQDAKARDAVHVVFAGKKVREEYPEPVP